MHKLERGDWALVVDDHGRGTMDEERLERIVVDASYDAIAAVVRHFRKPAIELFVLFGPPGVIAGSAPHGPPCPRVAMGVFDGGNTVEIGYTDSDDRLSGCELVPAGNAICWGPNGPEVLCDLGRRWVRAFPPISGERQTGAPIDRSVARTAISVSSSS